MENQRARITGEEILSCELRRTVGRWQKQEREAYASAVAVAQASIDDKQGSEAR